MATDVKPPDDLNPLWLQKKLITLLEDAASREEPDHQACAKYLDLAFKLLPRQQPDSAAGRAKMLDEIRKSLKDDKP